MRTKPSLHFSVITHMAGIAGLFLSASVFLWQSGVALALPASAKEKPDGKNASSMPVPPQRHALSLMGAPKYKPGFKHFDYVNPSAPKGGRVRLSARGSYDTLNIFTGKGEAANGLGLLYDSLMDTSLDQPGTNYCLLCEWVSYPQDYSSVTFKLRDEARWHDGKPVTPEDVIFSFETFTTHNPGMKYYYKNVKKAEKTGPGLVTFTFSVKGNRELPQIMGDLTVLPKHYWQGTDDQSVARNPSKSTLVPPLGSGPYQIAKMKRGASMTYTRVKNYWGRDIAVNKGRYNFDQIRFIYFHDDTVALEAFKGGNLDYRAESSSKNWATAYNFPAVRKLRVKKQEITLDNSPPMQSFILNNRRTQFKDRRVRQAFILAFNFEQLNSNLLYSQYKRVSSYFENTELAAKGLPTGKELALLRQIKEDIPSEIFTTAYNLPVNSSLRDFRKKLKKAAKLMDQAGWKIKNGMRHHEKNGQPFRVEFLIVQPNFERLILPYMKSLKKLGINSSIRIVDSAQYTRRHRNFDFDIIVGSFRQSETPGNEQRNYWSSEAADKPGSRNVIGIKNKAIDKLIDHIIFAKTRLELVAAARALDRVLLWNHYVVPQWYAPSERIAYWNKYGQPKTLPSRDVAFLTTWWYDQEKAQMLAKNGR